MHGRASELQIVFQVGEAYTSDTYNQLTGRVLLRDLRLVGLRGPALAILDCTIENVVQI